MFGLLSLFRQAVGAVCHKTAPSGQQTGLSVLSFNRLTNIFMAPRLTPRTTNVRAGEVLSGPDASVSILVLDEDGLLRNGASPNLPSDYLTRSIV
jgi:hypothetical protein